MFRLLGEYYFGNSFNLEIAFFSPALSLCLFFQRVNALYFFLSKKKGVFFFFKEAAT